MNCNTCLLGAPMYTCWQMQCPSYKNKKEKEEKWNILIKEYLKQMELVNRNEAKRNNRL